MKTYPFLAALRTELRKEDKIKHMVWSFWLLLGGLMLWPLPVALLLVFLIGLAKEVWDKYYGSGFCFYDLAGNFVGMAAALLVGLPLQQVWA